MGALIGPMIVAFSQNKLSFESIMNNNLIKVVGENAFTWKKFM